MKNKISTLQDALAYQLQGLFFAEDEIRNELTTCIQQIRSIEVRNEIDHYVKTANEKLQKLERIFTYLMQESNPRKNDVVSKMIHETHHLLKLTSSAHLKDILMISCVQNINSYKTASYKSAYLFAVELELDTAIDLIQQILEWELATGKRLALLSIHEFNKLNESNKIQ
ncbi:YciE/YciF ferroxidase family protein [Chryseotalea sanaruensis]|nr:DUF892 family protein [Chryseotalea sanaruensis]